MCHRQSLVDEGVFGRVWRGGIQDASENATTSTNHQRTRSRNRKKFRKWKKRSLMKRKQNLLTPQKKAMNHTHCGDHCLGWMGLNRAFTEANSNKPSVGFCCCSSQFHFNHYLHLLLNKSGPSSQSLKSVVR